MGEGLCEVVVPFSPCTDTTRNLFLSFFFKGGVTSDTWGNQGSLLPVYFKRAVRDVMTWLKI